MALGTTQPPTQMSTSNFSFGGKGGRCVGMTTLPPSCADYLEIGEPQPPGTLRACPGVFRNYFTFNDLSNMFFQEHLHGDGHNRQPKHVAG